MTQLATRNGIIHRLAPQNSLISDPPVTEESRRIRECCSEFSVSLSHLSSVIEEP
jgi:hypothetical protein